MSATDKALALVAFVVRCTAAAAIAYFLASAARLPHPLWACIFALIASSLGSAATLSTIGGRLIGTILGGAVSVAVNAAMGRFGVDVASQMIAAVAVCAVFAWERPAIQMCLWTPPIILMTAAPGETIPLVGVARVCEVILGLVIGGLLAWAAEKASRARRAERSAEE